MIHEVQKGMNPTLLDANKANEIIRAINNLLQIRGTDPISITVSEGAIQINSNLRPLPMFICENGEPADYVFYVAKNQVTEVEE